jgi:hypothetical protein
MFFLQLAVVTLLLRGVEAQCAGAGASVCYARTCCTGGGGGDCEWIGDDCLPTDRTCVPRKRLLANLTQILGEIDKKTETEIMNTDLPIPAAVAHLRTEIELVRRRAPIGRCVCSGGGCCPRNCAPISWGAWTVRAVRRAAAERAPATSTTRRHHAAVRLAIRRKKQRIATLRAAHPTVKCRRGLVGPARTPCGPGTQERTRYITVAEANGGVCPERSNLRETGSCNLGCCPQNCVHDQWSGWSACSANCGGGTQSRTRSITPAACGGSCSDTQTMQTQQCNTQCCRAKLPD